MNLTAKLNKDLVSAMKEKDIVKSRTIRAVKTAIKTAQIAKSTTEDLSDAEVLQVIQKQVKQRNDSIEFYKNNNREDLLEIEQSELNILNEYLPREATEAEMVFHVSNDTNEKKGDIIKAVKELLVAEGLTVNGKKLSEIVDLKLNK